MAPSIVDVTREARSVAHRFVAISGMPKSGTSLPLVLLDGHPDLIVFPEELRFFHAGCDRLRGSVAAERLLAEGNVALMSLDRVVFDSYDAHRGTGLGVRDYSNLDHEAFADSVRLAFVEFGRTRDRLLAVFIAFELAKRDGLRDFSAPRTFVSKAPHNELYGYRWGRALGSSVCHIAMIRDPVELFYTLYLGDRAYLGPMFLGLAHGSRQAAIVRFARTYRERLRLIHRLPPSRTLVVRYEDMIGDPRGTMSHVASLVEVSFHPSLLAPTKNGFPWSGNSLRGRGGEEVFANPSTARAALQPEVVEALERRLGDLMRRHDYPCTRPQLTSARLRDATTGRVRGTASLTAHELAARAPWTLGVAVTGRRCVEKAKAIARNAGIAPPAAGVMDGVLRDSAEA